MQCELNVVDCVDYVRDERQFQALCRTKIANRIGKERLCPLVNAVITRTIAGTSLAGTGLEKQQIIMYVVYSCIHLFISDNAVQTNEYAHNVQYRYIYTHTVKETNIGSSQHVHAVTLINVRT